MSYGIRPYLFGVGHMSPADLKYRFNWTSPIAVSATDPNTIYLGGTLFSNPPMVARTGSRFRPT